MIYVSISIWLFVSNHELGSRIREMKYYIIAGEASGDMHAANMMKELKKRDSDAYFRVWGGDKMKVEAQELAKHIKETSFMGIFQVVQH